MYFCPSNVFEREEDVIEVRLEGATIAMIIMLVNYITLKYQINVQVAFPFLTDLNVYLVLFCLEEYDTALLDTEFLLSPTP